MMRATVLGRQPRAVVQCTIQQNHTTHQRSVAVVSGEWPEHHGRWRWLGLGTDCWVVATIVFLPPPCRKTLFMDGTVASHNSSRPNKVERYPPQTTWIMGTPLFGGWNKRRHSPCTHLECANTRQRNNNNFFLLL